MPSLDITFVRRDLPAHRGKSIIPPLLEEAGHRVTEGADGPLENLAPESVVWMFGNANWFPVVRRQLLSCPRRDRPFVVVWHFEPLPPPRASGLPWPRLHLRELAKILLRDPRATDVYTNYLLLRRLAVKSFPDLLLVSTMGRCEFLVERGILAHWVPLGYNPTLGRDLGLPRDIDAVFLGALKVPRRRRAVKRLRRCGINLLAAGDWFDPACWGEERTRLLNRSKIFVNIQRFPGQFSGARLTLGMANRALVVSEPMVNPAPFVSGKHYVTAKIEEMPEVVDYYLRHEDERERIASEGHRFVVQELTTARSVSRILELIAEVRGAR